MSTAVTALVAAVLGLGVGDAANRVAARLPRPREDGRGHAVRRPVVELGTALLFALTGLRFGLSWELPAFLFLAAAGVLLTVVDVQHKLLPDRVTLPAIGGGAACWPSPRVGTGDGQRCCGRGWPPSVLFVVFFVLALISPRSLGMGDVKLAGLLGLYLGWLGWARSLVVGAAAGSSSRRCWPSSCSPRGGSDSRASCPSGPRCSSARRW